MKLETKVIHPPRMRSHEATRTESEFYREIILQMIAHRKRNKISQQELSDLIGVSESYVNKWEAGLKFPTLFSFMCWCKALNVKIKTEIVDEESNG